MEGNKTEELKLDSLNKGKAGKPAFFIGPCLQNAYRCDFPLSDL